MRQSNYLYIFHRVTEFLVFAYINFQVSRIFSYEKLNSK